MGVGQVNLETQKTRAAYPIPQDNTHSTGNTVVNVANPDVKVVITDPITPPGMILAQANTGTSGAGQANRTAEASNVEAVAEVTPAKPEFVIDISKYFQTSFLDLEEEATSNFNQLMILHYMDEERIKGLDALIIPVRLFLGKEKTIFESIRLSKELAREPQYQRALRHRQEHGKVELGEFPEWLVESHLRNSKRTVFKMIAMLDNHDYGLDVDYLSLPMIDDGVLCSKLSKNIHISFFILQETYKYDQLLNEYSGVATRGRLGRQLGVDGVELYNLWRELDQKGIITEHEMNHKDFQGKENTKKFKMWLEVASDINIKQLVVSLNVSENIRGKLENYLLGLQRGKKRDEGFIRRYEGLRNVYRERVQQSYSIEIDGLFLNVTERTQEDIERYNATMNEWVREYRDFDSFLRLYLRRLTLGANERQVSVFNDRFIKTLETGKEKFKGEIPLGQEYLFLLLENNERDTGERIDRSIYDIKFR
jgi:hypothetical protein